MEIRVLRYFLMVAREENITRAADFLHITQPTLSRQLQDLESELGVTLFERGSHSIHLTQDGLLLKRSAQEIVDLEEKARAQFTPDSEGISGVISLGCGELASMDTLAQWMADFSGEAPGVRFDIFSGNADEIKDRVEKGLLDFALLLEPVDISSYEFVRMRLAEKWCALVDEKSSLAKKEFLTASDLAGVPLILPARGNVRNQVMNWLGLKETEVNVAATANLPYNGAAAVRRGLGVSLSISLSCRYDGVVSVPLSPPLEHGSVLAWKRGMPHSRAMECFIAMVRESTTTQNR